MGLRENELRIGNIVGTPEEKFEILSMENLQKVINNLSNYNPVSITDKVLIKSGFIKNKKNNFYRINELEDYYLIFTGKIGMMYKVDRGAVGTPIRFLHELQNIYYYLSGREIEISVKD